MTPTPGPASAAGPIHTPSARANGTAAMVTAQRIDEVARRRYERTADLDMAIAQAAAYGSYVSLGQAASWLQS